MAATDENVIRAADIRTKSEVGSFTFDSSIESVCFDINNENEIHVALGDGSIAGLDMSKGMTQSYKKRVGKKAISSIDTHKTIKGLMCTTGMDSIMLAFDTRNRDETNCPKLVDKMLTQGGQLFNGSFYQDAECLYGCGSSSGEVILWALDGQRKVREAFGVQEQEMVAFETE